MCTAVALVGLAISAASAVTGFMGQTAQADAQEAMYEQNRLTSIQAMNDEVNQINLRTQQERVAASEELQAANRKQLADTATAEAAAGEFGVGGLSVDMLLGEIASGYGRDRANTKGNLDMTLAQLEQERRGSETTRDNRINSVARGRRPSPIGLGLGIAQAGLGAYNTAYPNAGRA